MPKELHDRLARTARAKGLSGERKDAYVYGTLNKVEKARTHKYNGARIIGMHKGA